MEGKDFLSAIQEVSIKLDSIIENVGISRITPFEGDPKLFRAWINEVERYAFRRSSNAYNSISEPDVI